MRLQNSWFISTLGNPPELCQSFSGVSFLYQFMINNSFKSEYNNKNSFNMTSQELRLGNLVYVNEDSVCRVYEINDLAFYVISDDECSYKNTTCDLQPIPLTEEWLIKFGALKRMDDDTVWYEFGIPINWFYSTFDVVDFESTGLTFSYHGIRQKLKYVHQLQNLYFALTGEELTLIGN